MLDLQSDQKIAPYQGVTANVGGVLFDVNTHPLPDLTTDQLATVYDTMGGRVVGGELFYRTKSVQCLIDAIRCTQLGGFIQRCPSVVSDICEVLLSQEAHAVSEIVSTVPVVLDLLNQEQRQQVGTILAECNNLLCVRLIDDINPIWAEYMFKRHPSPLLLPHLAATNDVDVIVAMAKIDWEMFRLTLRNISPFDQLRVLLTAMFNSGERTDNLRCIAILERISTECDGPWSDYNYCRRYFDSVLGAPAAEQSTFVDGIQTQPRGDSRMTVRTVPGDQVEERQRLTGFL